MTSRWLVLAAIPLLLAGSARAEDASRSWTLEALIAEAVRANPALLAARQQVEVARGRAVQGRQWPNPEIELSAEDMPVQGGGLPAAKNMLGLSQVVPFPAKTRLDSRIGSQAVQAAEWESRAREAGVIRDVKAAFCRALAAESKLAAARELEALAGSLADVASKRVEAGAAAAQERLRAEIELERARLDAATARRELTEAREGLAALIGRPDESVPPLPGRLHETILAGEIERLRGRALESNPERGAQVARRRAAELELSRAKVEVFPDLRLGVAYGCDGSAGEAVMELRVSLPLPLFDRAQGRRREARAQAAVARHDQAATDGRLLQELAVVEARLRASAEQVEAYRERILPKAREALRMVRGGFDAGKFGFLDVIDIQRTTTQARLDYWEQVLQLNLAIADLEALAGDGGRIQP